MLVPLFHKPFPPEVYHLLPECGACHTVHLCKTLHIDVDDTGAGIVSPEVWEDIKRVPKRGGFTLESGVKDPPTTNITPPTVKQNISGIDLAGDVAQPERVLYSTAGARRDLQAGDPVPLEKATYTLDEYFDIAEQHGISLDNAKDLLLRAILGLLPSQQPGQEVEHGDNRP